MLRRARNNPTGPAWDPNLYGKDFTMRTPGGDAHAMMMLELMAANIIDAQRHGYVRRVLRELATKTTDFAQRGLRIFKYIQVHQVFTKDPFGIDMPRHVDQLLYEMAKAGPWALRDDGTKIGGARFDCDDAAQVGAALHLACGDQVAFVLANKNDAKSFRHVYYAARPNSKADWTPFDPQETPKPFTWPRDMRRKIVPLESLAR